jgi:hypothetical protein
MDISTVSGEPEEQRHDRYGKHDRESRQLKQAGAYLV